MVKKSTIIIADTKSSKSQNEDSCGIYIGTEISAIAIADGLGSSLDSHLASELAVKTFVKKIKDHDEGKRTVNETDVISAYENIFQEIKNESHKTEKQYKSNEYNMQHMMQTTLISLVETNDRYIISYIGNGSIWYIRGDFWKIDLAKRAWPWCITDLMVGHAILQDGKYPLEGYISPKGIDSEIQCMSIMKNKWFGEVFILTTDGISSSEKLIIGLDDNQKVWIEVNPYMQKLLGKYLIEFLHDSKNSQNGNNSLKSHIRSFLDNNTFDDDATIGLLISQSVIENYLNANKC